MNITRKLTAVVFVFVLSTTSFAQFVDFSGQAANDPTWTANAFDGIVQVSFSSSFSDSAVRWTPQTKSFTDPAFQGMFGSSGSLIALVAQSEQTSASTNTTFVFSNPLPSNTFLVLMDLDGASERLAVSNSASSEFGGGFVAPMMMESNDPNESPLGASSFALWSQNQQRLLSTAEKLNDREAYLFDVSGMSDVTLRYSASEAAASWVGFAQAVPEPSTLPMIFIGLIALIRRRRS